MGLSSFPRRCVALERDGLDCGWYAQSRCGRKWRMAPWHTGIQNTCALEDGGRSDRLPRHRWNRAIRRIRARRGRGWRVRQQWKPGRPNCGYSFSLSSSGTVAIGFAHSALANS